MARSRTASHKQPKGASPGKGRLFKEYGEAIFVAAVLFLFLRSFVVQAYQIPSGSMEDTLLVGDFLVANKFLYGARVPFTEWRLPKVRDPERGDVIVFRAPHVDKDFIKRCIAVEGDTVELRDNKLYLNGELQDEPFIALKGSSTPYSTWGPAVVPPGTLLMLGDNRNWSDDGRRWGFLDKRRVEGNAMFLYFSWNKERFLPRIQRLLRPIR